MLGVTVQLVVVRPAHDISTRTPHAGSDGIISDAVGRNT